MEERRRRRRRMRLAPAIALAVATLVAALAIRAHSHPPGWTSGDAAAMRLVSVVGENTLMMYDAALLTRWLDAPEGSVVGCEWPTAGGGREIRVLCMYRVPSPAGDSDLREDVDISTVTLGPSLPQSKPLGAQLILTIEDATSPRSAIAGTKAFEEWWERYGPSGPEAAGRGEQ